MVSSFVDHGTGKFFRPMARDSITPSPPEVSEQWDRMLVKEINAANGRKVAAYQREREARQFRFWATTDSYLHGGPVTTSDPMISHNMICAGCMCEVATCILRGFGTFPTMHTVPYTAGTKQAAEDWLPAMCHRCLAVIGCRRAYHYAFQRLFSPDGTARQLLQQSMPACLVSLVLSFVYA